jgi:hypothetical protein
VAQKRVRRSSGSIIAQCLFGVTFIVGEAAPESVSSLVAGIVVPRC